MRGPLIVAWRVAMGVMAGTILGVFAGLSLFGAGADQGQALVRTIALGGLGGGGLVWLWERRQARELGRARRRVAPRRRQDSGSDNWPRAGA